MAEQSKGGAPSVGVIVDWTLKLSPIVLGATLWFVTLYSNQAAMIKHDDAVDRRLADIEKERNERDRALTERLARMDSDIRSVTHDLQFFQQTRSNGK
jgi:hypothetical protein